MSSKYQYVSTTKNTKLRIDDNSTTYSVLKFIWESGKEGRRYSEIVRFIVEDIKNEKYDSSKRGYWATNLILRKGHFNSEEGILIKYAGKNDNGRWILKDPLIIAHFEGHTGDGKVESSNGDVFWLKNNTLHNESGPAVIRNNGDLEYYINGKQIEEVDFLMKSGYDKSDIEILDTLGLFEMFMEINENKTPVKSTRYFGKDRIEEWRIPSEWGTMLRHREDGPASIRYVGDTDEVAFETWYRRNMVHREDGPAKINHESGVEKWFKNGNLHREGGPAVIQKDGRKEWLVDGEYHREDGPSVIRSNGDLEYHVNGKRHREDGPALVLSNGKSKYFLDGWEVDKSEVDRLMLSKLGTDEEDLDILDTLGLFDDTLEEDMIAPMDSGSSSPGTFFQSPETMAGSMDTMSLAGPLSKNKGKSKKKSKKKSKSKILSFKDFISAGRK